MEVLVGMQELKINTATEATEKILNQEQNISHKVLDDLINAKVEERMKLEKKKQAHTQVTLLHDPTPLETTCFFPYKQGSTSLPEC